LGIEVPLVQNVALRIDARGIYMDQSEYVFGSTKYIDHAPTDNWTYKIDSALIYTLTAGVCIDLK
jgi:hypothetical protein